MPRLLDIRLQRNDSGVPWGFQVRGGLDRGCHPVISAVTFGTLASRYLNAGDKILEIEKQNGNSLLEAEIDRLLRSDHPSLHLLVEKLPTSSAGGTQMPEMSVRRTGVLSEHECVREKTENGRKRSTRVWLRESNKDPALGEYDLEMNFERTKYRENGEVNGEEGGDQRRMQVMSENFEKIFRKKIGEWLEVNMLNGWYP